MEIEELNRRFGAPGRIVFREGHCGRPVAALSCKYGTAEIALMGANTLSYRPTGHSPVLFMPKGHVYARGEKVHGGIPLCWPQFGGMAIAGMGTHGFARIMPFSVKASQYSGEMAELTLLLESNDETKALWPHDFRLEVRISVSMKLNLYATTTNTGAKPFEYTAGFHPYLLVKERDGTALRGVDGLEYTNADGMTRHAQHGDLAMDKAVNLVFELPSAPKHEFALIDGALKRAIAVAAHGADRLVAWNPGDCSGFGDTSADDWRRFACVEPVTAWPKAARPLAPGESETLAVAIQSVSMV